MKRTALITVAMIVAAATAQAQFPGSRGMGRGRGGDREGGERREAPPAPLSRADVEKQDPIVVLLSNRPSLALTDSQFTRLAGLDAGLMEKNRPLMAQYDSLYALVPTGAEASNSSVNDAAARGALFGVLRDVRRNYTGAEQDALALLNPDQRSKAQKLLDDLHSKQRESFTAPRR